MEVSAARLTAGETAGQTSGQTACEAGVETAVETGGRRGASVSTGGPFPLLEVGDEVLHLCQLALVDQLTLLQHFLRYGVYV